MSKLKIAIVGCGRIAQKHLQAIRDNDDRFELVACCDIVVDKAKALVDDIAYYQDLTVLLKQEELDVISLCTPSGLHCQQAILASEYGVNVVSEKPMATNWEDGLRMYHAFEDKPCRLFVVKQNRLNPTIQYLKKAIENNWFGKLYVLQSNVFWTRPQAYYDQADWRGTYAMDGGALMNQASHYVDLLAWLGGSVVEVQAMAATLARRIEAEDTISLNLRYGHGAIGSMCVTMLTYPKNLEGSITIMGEDGTVKLGGIALNKFEHWDFADESVPSIDEVNNLSYQTDSVYGNGHGPYYHNVADCLLHNAPAISDGKSGLSSLALITAAYASAAQGNNAEVKTV